VQTLKRWRFFFPTCLTYYYYYSCAFVAVAVFLTQTIHVLSHAKCLACGDSARTWRASIGNDRSLSVVQQRAVHGVVTKEKVVVVAPCASCGNVCFLLFFC
jgi:hypothetical protein